MPQETTDRLMLALDQFNERGTIASGNLTPDFELIQASSILDSAGVFRGPDAVAGAMEELRASFDELRFEVEEVFEAPGGEVVLFVRASGRGRGSDIEVNNPIAWVVTFRGDAMARIVVFEEREDALESVGLPE